MHASIWGSTQSSPHLDSTGHNRTGEQRQEGARNTPTHTHPPTHTHMQNLLHLGCTQTGTASGAVRMRCTVPTSPMSRHSWATQVGDTQKQGPSRSIGHNDPSEHAASELGSLVTYTNTAQHTPLTTHTSLLACHTTRGSSIG
jgi:hypothetical protein